MPTVVFFFSALCLNVIKLEGKQGYPRCSIQDGGSREVLSQSQMSRCWLLLWIVTLWVLISLEKIIDYINWMNEWLLKVRHDESIQSGLIHFLFTWGPISKWSASSLPKDPQSPELDQTENRRLGLHPDPRTCSIIMSLPRAGAAGRWTRSGGCGT